MHRIRFKVKAFSRLNDKIPVPEVEPDPSGYHISEFLSLVRINAGQLLMRPDLHQQRLHLILLGSGNDPLYAVPALIDLLEKTLFLEYHRLILCLPEKLGRIRAQAFDQIQKRDHRRCHDSVLQL